MRINTGSLTYPLGSQAKGRHAHCYKCPQCQGPVAFTPIGVSCDNGCTWFFPDETSACAAATYARLRELKAQASAAAARGSWLLFDALIERYHTVRHGLWTTRVTAR